MIGWGDVYKVVAATVPLYFALFLGYGSVRWWRIFTREQCDAVNRLVAFFALPFFTFEFTLHTDPFQVNYRAVAADVISKAVIVAVIGAWARFMSKGGCAVSWSITSFSLSTLTNSLVVGVPMARAMYGEWAQQLVVQLSVFQAIVWLTLLLFVLEVRKAAIGMYVDGASSSEESSAAPAASKGRHEASAGTAASTPPRSLSSPRRAAPASRRCGALVKVVAPLPPLLPAVIREKGSGWRPSGTRATTGGKELGELSGLPASACKSEMAGGHSSPFPPPPSSQER